MNRKLHNSFTAFAAVGAVLVLGVLLARPVAPGQASAGQIDSLAQAAALTAELATATALGAALGPVAEGLDTDSETRPARTTAHRRQTLVMPYFSFASRG